MVTLEEVCLVVLTFSFLPAFLSRPLRATLPPGEGMDFFRYSEKERNAMRSALAYFSRFSNVEVL